MPREVSDSDTEPGTNNEGGATIGGGSDSLYDERSRFPKTSNDVHQHVIQQFSEERATVDLQALIERTADPAFACDQAGRITAWNAAAEGFLGYPAESAVGRACHAVIAARGPSGNIHCQEDCSLRKMIRCDEPIHSFGMQVRRASGEFDAVRCSVFVLCETQQCREYSLLHVLQPVHELRQAAFLERARWIGDNHRPEGSGCRPGSPGDPRQLTAREMDILRLLADGHTTRQVAKALHVSTHTVRTHIQHVLYKLDAHSQLQAVAFARRRNLI